MRVRLCHLVLVLVGMYVSALAEEPRTLPKPEDVIRTFPQTALSADGTIRVTAAVVAGDRMGFRDPILHYAVERWAALAKGLGLKELPRRSRPSLVLMAQDGRTNDTRVVAQVAFNRRLGQRETRIYLPSPGYSSFEQLNLELARAFCRAHVDALLELPLAPQAPAPAPAPAWFVVGLVRHARLEQARADMRAVIDTYFAGAFPFFPACLSDAASHPERAGYLVGWMKEKHLFTRFFADLAQGKAWTEAAFAYHLTGTRDPIHQDRIADERLLRLTRKVISPGSVAESDFKIFSSRLLLYSPFYDKIFGDSYPCCSFRTAALQFSADAEMRRVAARRAREIPLWAIGRGEALQQAALAYMDFLAALASGEEPGRLLMRLDEADLKLAAARPSEKEEKKK